MQNSKPIQFLLHQLQSNPNYWDVHEKNWNNFLTIWTQRKYPEILKRSDGILDNSADEYIIELFIRTCLSLVNGQAVLGVFEGMDKVNIRDFTYLLYNAFEWPLYYGANLDIAISELHDKMFELIPEYQEFLKNNK